MENLYRLEEYSGKLPNPKSFPVRGATITAVKDMPNTFSDNFILELSVREADKKMLEEKVHRTINYVSNLLEEAEVSKVLLSEPEFIYDFSYPMYILFTPFSNITAMQIKYYKYFRNRYPKCKFYLRKEGSIIITIKVLEKVVGMCMPIFLENNTIKRMKEVKESEELLY